MIFIVHVVGNRYGEPAQEFTYFVEADNDDDAVTRTGQLTGVRNLEHVTSITATNA